MHKVVSCILILFLPVMAAVPVQAAENPEVVIAALVETPDGACGTVCLEPEDTAFPMPGNFSQTACYLSFREQGSFQPIRFRRPGIYEYRLRQIPGDNPDCLYDTEPYHLQITVTRDSGGRLSAFTTGTRDGVKTNQFQFRNSFKEVTGKTDSPRTGDPGMPWLCLTLMAAAGTGIFYGLRKRK